MAAAPSAHRPQAHHLVTGFQSQCSMILRRRTSQWHWACRHRQLSLVRDPGEAGGGRAIPGTWVLHYRSSCLHLHTSKPSPPAQAGANALFIPTLTASPHPSPPTGAVGAFTKFSHFLQRIWDFPYNKRRRNRVFVSSGSTFASSDIHHTDLEIPPPSPRRPKFLPVGFVFLSHCPRLHASSEFITSGSDTLALNLSGWQGDLGVKFNVMTRSVCLWFVSGREMPSMCVGSLMSHPFVLCWLGLVLPSTT